MKILMHINYLMLFLQSDIVKLRSCVCQCFSARADIFYNHTHSHVSINFTFIIFVLLPGVLKIIYQNQRIETCGNFPWTTIV